MESRKTNTYILFSKKGRGISTVVGPLFETELRAYKERYFGFRKTHIVEENAFAARYPNRYHNHIQENWCDKLYCYFTCNLHWAGSVTLSRADKCILGSWFTLCELQDVRGKYFQLSLSVEANKFYAAKLRCDINDMGLMHIQMGESFYKKDNIIYIGDKALSTYLAYELIDNMCLT